MDIETERPQANSDLIRRDAGSAWQFGGVEKVGNECGCRWPEIVYRITNGFENGIAKQANLTDRQG